MKNMLKYHLIILIAFATILVACNKEENETVTENFVTEQLNRMERGGDLGFRGCFELVFPVTLEFPDGTSADANDTEELRNLTKEWFQNNGPSGGRPQIAYPFQVTLEDGNLFEITNEEDKLEVLQECGSGNGHGGGIRNFSRCYELIFPVTIAYPDGTTETVASKEELRAAIKDWKENNPTATDRPTLAFPFDVQKDDGTIVTVESIEDLKALKEACGPRPHGPKCFKLVLPVTIEFPDGTTAEATSHQELRELAKEWKMNNPGATERPHLAFPFEVELIDDGTIVTIESEEDLEALREDCEG